MMLPDLIVRLAEQKLLSVRVAESILGAIKARYRKGVVEHSLMALRER